MAIDLVVSFFLCSALFVPGALLYKVITANGSMRANSRSVETSVAMSFLLSLALACVVYAASFGGSLLPLRWYLLGSSCCAAAFVIVRFRHIVRQAGSLSSLFALPAVIFAAFVAVAAVQGRNPIFFSDVWGHLSIVRRLWEHNTTVVHSVFYPGEIYMMVFAPWHSVLAALGGVMAVEPLAIWRVCQVFLPCVLVLSFLSFAGEILPLRRDLPSRALLAASFVLLYPGVYQLLRGEADYRVVNHIILFQALRLFWLVWHYKERSRFRENIALFVFCTLLLSAIHLVETALLALITCGYCVLSVWGSRHRLLRIGVLAIYAAWLVVIQLSIVRAFFSFVNLPLSTIPYDAFLAGLFTHWRIYLGAPGLLALCALPYVVRRLPRSTGLFLMSGTVFGTILGSYNPLLYPLYNNLMKSELAWRVILLFPSYLIVGVLLAIAWKRRRPMAPPTRWIITVLVTLSVGHYLFKLWGIDGQPSYFWSDRVSQLHLYPRFYEFVRQQQGKIFLGDPFTSVPIAAISSNFALSHRPWNALDEKRYLTFRLLGNKLDAKGLKEALRYYKVDYVIVNTNEAPPELKDEQHKYPDLYRFRTSQIAPLPRFLKQLGAFNGIVVYATNVSH